LVYSALLALQRQLLCPCWLKSRPFAVIDVSGVTLVVLGAGLARRFGQDKLATMLDTRPLAHHLLDVVGALAFPQKLLVARGQAWTHAYSAAGFTVLDNPHSEMGPGASLGIALAASEQSALLVCLADMPFVTASHLLRLIETYRASLDVVCSAAGRYRGPPAVIPCHLLKAGDLAQNGARSLLSRAPTVAASRYQLQDVDTPEDLASLGLKSLSAAPPR
jgi:molybdenum cofactor cytidylyltransferase